MLRLVDTDFDLARQVGAILHASASCLDVKGVTLDQIAGKAVEVPGWRLGTERRRTRRRCLRPSDGGQVVASDLGDIMNLAGTVPAARVRVVAL
jgi:hypothetical protein